MPVIILYLLKLSLSLAVVFSFYHFVLRRLTFYNWNRFYLVAYTALSFFIPFINITPVLERNEMMNSPAVQFIPSVNTFTNTDNAMPVQNSSIGLTYPDGILLFFAAGIIVLMVRMLMQLFSFRRIVNNATLISSDNVKLYQVEQSIIPFSFGNSIFINKQQHNEQELEEIIRHEFVHIRQKHTIDIIWSEILCIVNWYNPFVWLIRRAIRQNLEFIADDKVLQSGIDKKQYQYLLLKVTGNNYFSIASQFNFSSLKKRIVMMNKMKSAGVHLLKFLFILPLMAVLILSFRNGRPGVSTNETVFAVQGIIYDMDSENPVANVLVVDSAKGIQTISDENGFYIINLPVNSDGKVDFTLSFSRDGYKYSQERFAKSYPSELSKVILIGILNANSQNTKSKLPQFDARDGNGQFVTQPDYKFVRSIFEQAKMTQRVDEIVGNSEKPIWVIDNIPFAVGAGAKAWFSKDEVEQSSEFRVWVDGTVMTMDEANRIIKRSMVRSVGASTKAAAKEQYNVNYNLLILGLYKDETAGRIDTLPAQSTLNSKNYLITIEDNKGNCTIVIKDKNKKEVKRLLLTEWNDKKDHYEKLYGELPASAKSLNENSPDVSINGPSKQYDQNFFERQKQPLVILDGVEQPENTDPASLLQPSEIFEMTVWKAEDAVAKYGYNAKNGVIVLTSRAYAARTIGEAISATETTGINEKPVAVTSVGTTITELPGKPAAISVEKVGTAAPVKSSVSSTGLSPVKSSTLTTVKPVQITTEPKSPVSVIQSKTATESVSIVKEVRAGKNIIAVLKSSTTEAEVKKIESDLKNKGYDFKINKVEFKEGKLVLINGTISKNSKRQYFTASDFAKLVISDGSEEDKDNRFNFMVMSGNLNVSDKVQ